MKKYLTNLWLRWFGYGKSYTIEIRVTAVYGDSVEVRYDCFTQSGTLLHTGSRCLNSQTGDVLTLQCYADLQIS